MLDERTQPYYHKMNRTNDQWTTALKQRQGFALVELRDALFRNLQKALSNRPRVDDAFLEDAVQESVMRILDRLDQFQRRSQFITWATSIAIRVAMGELRRSRWKDVSLDSVVAGVKLDRVIDASGSPEAQLGRKAIVRSMYEVMSHNLTEKQRTALLAELKGMPQDEIARHLGSNRNAIYKLTHDARKKLRKGLEALGYSADDIIASTNARA